MLTVGFILSGLVISIRKFPDYVKFLLRVNPVFITVGIFEYLYIDDCDIDYGSSNFCRATVLTISGYSPYNEPGYGFLCVYAWTGLFYVLTMGVYCVQFVSTGVFVDRSIDGDMRDALTSPNKRQHSTSDDHYDSVSHSDSDEIKSQENDAKQKQNLENFRGALERVSKFHAAQSSDFESDTSSSDGAHVKSTGGRSPSKSKGKIKKHKRSRNVSDPSDEELDSEGSDADSDSDEKHDRKSKRFKSPHRSPSNRLSRGRSSASRKRRDYDSSEYDEVPLDPHGNTDDDEDAGRWRKGDGKSSRQQSSSRLQKSEEEQDSSLPSQASDRHARDAVPPLGSGLAMQTSFRSPIREEEYADRATPAEVPPNERMGRLERRENSTAPAYESDGYNDIPPAATGDSNEQELRATFQQQRVEHEVEMPVMKSVRPFSPQPVSTYDEPVGATPKAPETYQKEPMRPIAAPAHETKQDRHETVHPTSPPVSRVSDVPIDTSEAAPPVAHESTPETAVNPPSRRKSVKEIMAALQLGPTATPSRAPPPVPTVVKEPSPPPSFAEESTFSSQDYDLFYVEQTVQDGFGVILSVVIDFKGNVASKKEILLGITDDHRSLKIALVSSAEEEIHVPLLRPIDVSTIKSKFNKGACALNVTASVLEEQMS